MPVQGFDSLFTHKKVGLAFHVSSELLEDDQFRTMANKPKTLARAVRMKVENDAASVLKNADSSSFTGPDGLSLSNAAHLREDNGATQSNRATGALTEANLETALINIAGLLDGKGQKILIKPDLLVVPVNLKFRFLKV